MPPKKVLKIDPQQCKLTSFLKNTSSAAEELQNDTSSVDINDNIVSKEKSEKKKDRKFQSMWLGLYSWLRYVPSENNADDYMFCSVCTDYNKVNGMSKLAKCQNFQHSTLSRHVSLSEHKMCIEAPLHRENMAQCQLKNESREDKAMKVLLKCIHWISSENLPLSKFKSLINLLHDLEVPDVFAAFYEIRL
ncbi:hypothetical protein DPMN_102017 [Dreissena polymorpha]|jgi:hypothetical protein|uniref:TTF-type domain-containing protein n=1 Tax=Dreissena polymorpha TaxID=45954 RepID=A0A9D4LKC8_DREPO|nr:hypothetical protein DPMN_102017 [Dreissena polymorpha]